MALQKTKSISLEGKSVINGTVVVRMTASLSTTGSTDSVNQYVQNVDLYNANKKDVRKDIAAFQEYVYEQQDDIDAEMDADKKTATEEAA
ncbi:hypothetical protein [Limosilactobacillus reuteri]|uniref:hypothetical protein n=1 Tax=Limosilactobacillus reuteri TaxID=1598 RepID=UPI001C5A7A09|nr:hypothetical protein [Limosilactobacillus reuteri]MBW3350608.1 hypothetical protein [Limosilactobacillus reuteri]UUW69652.1 hypothetical protein NUJ10_11475 [Limosilactobacillus reuteri]